MRSPEGTDRALKVTALVVSAELGGTERVLLDFATRAFEFDVALRVLAPAPVPLIEILNDNGVPARVVAGSRTMLRGSQRGRAMLGMLPAVAATRSWGRAVRRHPFMTDAAVCYSVSFKTHLATLGWRGRPPVVWHLHEFPPTGTGPLWKRLARRGPVATIANSRAVASAWAGRQPLNRSTAQPPLVIPNGVDLDRFRPRERTGWLHDRLGISRDDRIIAMPAVLARWKGQLEVIEAFAGVTDQFPEAHLVLVGGSIYHTVAEERYGRELAQEIARRRAQGLTRIHHLPFQRDIEAVYPECDLVVHYSLRPEAFGRVVVEAMACGTPVIAAAEGGPREIVTEGGWLVEPRRPEALAAALVGALRLPPAELAAVGRQGRVRAEDRYSARRFAQAVAETLSRAARPAPD